MTPPKKAAAKKPAVRKPAARKPAAKAAPRKTTARKPAAKKPPAKRVECKVKCSGQGDRSSHTPSPCTMEKGHGGMHCHQPVSSGQWQHVYRTPA